MATVDWSVSQDAKLPAHRDLWWPTWLQPMWTASSCLIHMMLVGVLVLLRPAPEPAEPSLRVRLVEEAKEPAPIAAQATAPLPTPFPIRHRVPRRPAPIQPSTPHAIVHDEPPDPSASPTAPVSIPTSSPPAGPAAAGRSDGNGEAGSPPEEPILPNQSGSAASSGIGDAAPAPMSQASEDRSGVFLISGGGNGMGPSELGSGIGSGSGGKGFGAEPGGTGEGSGTGPGRGGGGVASLGGRGGSGSGNGSGLTDRLGTIRRKIEQAKVYPEAARREGMQGTVELRFRIAGDGSVEAVEIVRSSGHPVLDEASAQTIRRAGPYPILAGWIRIPLSYRLDR